MTNQYGAGQPTIEVKSLTEQDAKAKMDEFMAFFKDVNFPIFIIIPTESDAEQISCVTYSSVCEACIIHFIGIWAWASGINFKHVCRAAPTDEYVQEGNLEIKH